MKKSIFITLLCVCFSTMTYAQKEGFSVYGAGTFPVGDASWATSCGFSVGGKYQYNLPVKGLGAIATVDMFFSGLSKDGRALYEIDESDYTSCKVRTPKSFIVPLMAGVNYNYAFNENIAVWAETALGLGLDFSTNYKFSGTKVVDYQSPQSRWHYSYKSTTTTEVRKRHMVANCAYQLGIGTMLWQRVSVGLHFYIFGGASKIKTTIETTRDVYQRYRTGQNSTEKTTTNHDTDTDVFISEEVDPMLKLSLRVGYHF